MQESIALKLDEGFTVTFGRTHGDLSKWLLEPKPHLAERFGFAKELLAIYSRHKRTDARVLTAIENIARDPEFKHRIDRAVVLLIHSGDPDETRTLLREKLDWIIVPIHVTDLLASHRGDLFLRSQIAAAIGAIDLFAMSSPITDDKYFFGRDDLVQQLITRSVEQNESSGLFGLRKTGKTSVLFALKRRLASTDSVVEYLDCQNPGIHAARWWEVLTAISGRLLSSLRERKRTTTLRSPYSANNAGSLFLIDIRSLLAN